ncbi:helix-turn-helix domain-containing protein [Pseudomonas vlassakiae]|uniref:Helix-turn-helix transcriptional regulator n=1 Tax=Pseudomonas vlassakiae TaxID=485888 RepID=A0A923GIV2_9PSED|nr:helix-turn-helix domain-containing protein [Pseudomonas vlassakiae]MBV4541714.1 helix-turn-helix transcriptional regulator [Pseudomonas vlassakiae]
MFGNTSFHRYSYSGLDPALACDVVYGGHFEHRLMSARHSNMTHQRLTSPDIVIESGSYDFPVVACGLMPLNMLCVGLVADGAESTRYNTSSIDDDEIQIYPPGAELLYHAGRSSRWITFVAPETTVQAAVIARTGRPFLMPKRDATSLRLPKGSRAHLVQLADDAFALGRTLESTGISEQLAACMFNGLLDTYAGYLGQAQLVDSKRMATAQQHLQLILACEHLALQNDSVSLDLDDVARRSGYSRRALEMIFNRTIGMPPGRWFMNIRLNEALRDLLTAKPGCQVIDVASRWGFRHFSRFAYQYRRTFGELPSETLQRAQR